MSKMGLEEWLENGAKILRGIGLKKGQIILDFGCGKGNYSIPASKVVGETGLVYSLDKNSWVLDELKKRARSIGLPNIVILETSGEVEFDLENSHLDVVLLYDIFWYFPIYDNKLTKLLDEVNRVLKDGGILSVFPKHIEAEKLSSKILRHGFAFKDIYRCTLLHDGSLEKGKIYNFITVK
jgi:ubiquinone/menaquinone biosynthesis C-methylase UbiE